MAAHQKPGATGGSRTGYTRQTQHHSTKPSELILPRLNRVVSRGPGQWSASCPTRAHAKGDRSRGLSIRETSEGVMLLKCFGGCSADEVVGALGLELADLFPRSQADDRGDSRTLRRRPRLDYRAALEGLESRLWAVSLAFNDVATGLPFSPVDAAFISATAAELASILAEVRDGVI